MNTQNTNRRNFLRSAAGILGAAILGNMPAAAQKSASAARPSKTTNRNFIETEDGANLYCKDWGSGEAIVFVHSWGVNSDLWQYQMNDLCEQGFRAVAYDRRGHGRSSQPWNGYDYDTLAADLNTVIETLKLERVTLVSHSMAGGEIVRYLTRYGSKRVARAVIASPNLPFMLKTADNPNGVDKSFFENFRAVLKRDVPGTLRAGAASFVGDNPKLSKDLIEWTIELFRQTSLRALLECNRSNTETDFRRELAKINVPTLLIHGDEDVSAPIDLTAKRCAEMIPNAKLKIYKGAPHGIILTHKEEMARDIAEFIKA